MRISDWVQTCALPICPAGRVDPAQAAQALADAVRELGLDALPWSEGLRQWRARVLCLREWMPALGLPDLGDETLLATLDDWLRTAFAGTTRPDALSFNDLAGAQQAPPHWTPRQPVEQPAPTTPDGPHAMPRPHPY